MNKYLPYYIYVVLNLNQLLCNLEVHISFFAELNTYLFHCKQQCCLCSMLAYCNLLIFLVFLQQKNREASHVWKMEK